MLRCYTYQCHALNTLLDSSSSIRNKSTTLYTEAPRTQPSSPPIPQWPRRSSAAAAADGRASATSSGHVRRRDVAGSRQRLRLALRCDVSRRCSRHGEAAAQARVECHVRAVLAARAQVTRVHRRGRRRRAPAVPQVRAGGSLADVVARNGGLLDESAARAYAADVLRGLDFLHGKLVVHGDVKGSNVVVPPVLGGTPAFMAPEVARGKEQGPVADVWALGCTVVEMATGRAPWSDMDNVLAVLYKIGYTDAMLTCHDGCHRRRRTSCAGA
uniref:Protein kinase domain-containing protein n=1 Tax=Oryza punctata TaxID=4537 RepID=A0A0E0M576_ORYPU